MMILSDLANSTHASIKADEIIKIVGYQWKNLNYKINARQIFLLATFIECIKFDEQFGNILIINAQ